MSIGLLNLPAPLFDVVDGALAHVLPGALRLVFWAALGGATTLLLYRLLSPQQRIGAAKRQAKAARQRLNAFDGDFADAGPLIRDQFVTSFKHMGLVVPGTLLAIIPLLCLLVWAENNFGHRLPGAGDAPSVASVPADAANARWIGDRTPPHVRVDHNGQTLADIAMTAPVTVIAKPSVWDWLMANPVGELPAGTPVDRVRIDLPERHYLPFGPEWLRGWLSIFIPVMFVVSLGLYIWAGIE